MMNEWSVERLLQQSSGYWVSATLHAGVKHDVFTPLAKQALTVEQLAEIVDCDRRGLGMLLDALTSLGLLVKEEGVYRVGEFAAAHLVRGRQGQRGNYLGDIVMHHHHLMESWAHLDRSVDDGKPYAHPSLHDDDVWHESFLKGMFNLASMRAPQVAKLVDLQLRKRLLDLGGGPGTYAIHFCQANPDLSATIFDRPESRLIASETIARFDLQERIDFHAGDFNLDSLPTGYDAAWLSHILHGEGPEDCLSLLKSAVAALEPGGVLLIQEFILDDDGCSPVFPALFALNMLLRTESGRAYRHDELVEMMTSAGLGDVRRLSEETGNGIGVVCGQKADA